MNMNTAIIEKSTVKEKALELFLTYGKSVAAGAIFAVIMFVSVH